MTYGWHLMLCLEFLKFSLVLIFVDLSCAFYPVCIANSLHWYASNILKGNDVRDLSVTHSDATTFYQTTNGS